MSIVVLTIKNFIKILVKSDQFFQGSFKIQIFFHPKGIFLGVCEKKNLHNFSLFSLIFIAFQYSKVCFGELLFESF